jgi:hypothetical protein
MQKILRSISCSDPGYLLILNDHHPFITVSRFGSFGYGPVDAGNICERPNADRLSTAGRRPGHIDEQGFGVVTEQRMYTLVRQSAPIADRQFGIEFSRPWRGGLCLHVRLIGSDIQTNGELP